MKSIVLCCLVLMFFKNCICEGGNWISPEERAQELLLLHCKDTMSIKRCASRNGFSLTVNEVFSLITSHPEHIPLYCNGLQIQECLGNCADEFRSSRYGFMYSMCLVSSDILRERQCWTASFPDEARRCFARYYPSYRQKSFYPIPIRAYDLDSISRNCFPNDEAHCQQQKSSLLYNLMPTYFESHALPSAFTG